MYWSTKTDSGLFFFWSKTDSGLKHTWTWTGYIVMWAWAVGLSVFMGWCFNEAYEIKNEKRNSLLTVSPTIKLLVNGFGKRSEWEVRNYYYSGCFLQLARDIWTTFFWVCLESFVSFTSCRLVEEASPITYVIAHYYYILTTIQAFLSLPRWPLYLNS